MGRRGEVYSKDIQIQEQEDRECYMSRGQRIRNAKNEIKASTESLEQGCRSQCSSTGSRLTFETSSLCKMTMLCQFYLCAPSEPYIKLLFYASSVLVNHSYCCQYNNYYLLGVFTQPWNILPAAEDVQHWEGR